MTTPADQPADPLARLRERAAQRRELRKFFTEHPNLDDATRTAITRAPAGYNPRDHVWSAAEAYAASPDICRECYTARPYPPGQRHFGWALWRDCNPQCGHEHHTDEVWIG